MAMTFQQFLANEAKKNAAYSFSSVQIDLPADLAKRIVNWGRRNVPQASLFKSLTDKTFGRELHPHITVLYGIHTDKASRIRNLLSTHPAFEIALGKMSVFETNEKFDVLKIEVKSPDLFRLNKSLADSLYTTQTHAEYKPHVTIGYLNKEEADKWKGAKNFDDVKFDVKSIIFSSFKGTKTTIRLKGKDEKSLA